MAQLKSKASKKVKYFLDEFLPPVIRDQAWFYKPIIWIWNKNMDPDFKRKAIQLSDNQFKKEYEKLVPMRSTDMTPLTINFVLDNLRGESILEVGCGNGEMSILCAKRGYSVTATDIAEGNLNILNDKLKNERIDVKLNLVNIENIQFMDKTFDTTICLHTLEHVRNINKSIEELKRVTRQRIIVIVPKQKYFKYTCDYHLNFFGGPEQLNLAFGIKYSNCSTIDHCLCFTGDL